MNREELRDQVSVVAVDVNPTKWAVYCDLCECYLGEAGIETKEQNRLIRIHVRLHEAAGG